MPGTRAGVMERIERHSMPIPHCGCWVFLGHLNHHGYGVIGVGKSARLVHRVAFEGMVGPIPRGMQIDHKCRVRCCWNPAHLEIVTPLENWRRGIAPTAKNATKTHCKNGHPFDGANTYRGHNRGRNRRHCRECGIAADRRYRARKRAAE